MKNSSRIVPMICLSAAMLVGCEQADSPAANVQAASQTKPAPAERAPATPAPAPNPVGAETLTAPAAPAQKSVAATPTDPPAHLANNQLTLRAEPMVLDLGEVPTGDIKTGKVKLTNTGNEPVTVQNARASCGCTAMKFQPNTVINPKESIEVDVTMTGPGQPGDISGKTVTFVIQNQPELVVQVKGKAISFVTVEPTALDPYTMPEGKFTLKSKDGQPFKIMSVQPQVVEFPSHEPAAEHTLHVSWDRYREIGINRQMIVYLDHPKCQNVIVKVNFNAEELAEANRKLQEQQMANNESLKARNAAAMAAANQPKVEDPDTVLANMIREGRNSEVMAKIQTGLDVNYRDAMGVPLVSKAAAAGNADLLKALLATNKVDINISDNQGRTPLMHAATSKNAEAVRVLIDAGSNVALRDALGGTALWWAGLQGNGETVRELIDAGADVEVVGTVTGWTPLIVAAGFGDPASIEPLIKAHANLEVMDMIEGATPLIHAARTGDIESLKLLIKHGANLENADRNGNTAFLACAKSNNGELDKLEVLIKAGANIHAKDNRGLNALQLAQRRTDGRAANVVVFLGKLLGEETSAPAGAPASADSHAGHDH